MSVTLSISKGTLHVVVAFDIGFAVNLEACRRSVTDLTELAAIRHKGAAPAYFQFDPLPLRVTQRIPRLDLGAGFASTDEVEIVIYDFGGVSVIYDIPIQGSLEPLIQLSARLNASSMVRDDARSRIEHLMAVIEPAVIRPNIEKLTEEYYIVHVQAFEVPAAPEALIAAHAHDLARLLRAETDPLSDQEVQDALSSRASFGRSDVAIIDWNAAFLLDSEPQDVISVLEFANLQLLELRNRVQEYSTQVNENEREIDRLQASLINTTAATGVECVKRLGSFCCLTMQEVLRLLACFWLTGAGWEVL